MTNEQAELINKLNRISCNYTLSPTQVLYEWPSLALRFCLDNAGIKYELKPSGLYIAL